MKKRGSATAADGASMQARVFDVIMKKHIIKGMEKEKADGFAPGDMLINKFNGGDTGSAPAIVDTIQYRKCQSMKKIAHLIHQNMYFLTSQRLKHS